MFDKLFDLFLPENRMIAMYNLASSLRSLINLFDEEYLKDKDSKNAAIDAIIAILEKHKDKENA